MGDGYVLRHGDRSIALRPGENVIGRASGCAVMIDDALVSRRHAVIRLTADRLEVEDLGSRNGVLVDGELIDGKHELTHGAVVGIGNARLIVLEAGRRERVTLAGAIATPSAPATPRKKLSSGVHPAPTSGTVTGASIAVLVLQARAMLNKSASSTPPQDGDKLRSITNKLMEQLVATRVSDDVLLAEGVAAFSGCALELARRDRNGEWIDRVFTTHAQLGRALDRRSTDELVALAPQLACDAAACAAYLEALSSTCVPVGPDQVEDLRRIESLLGALG